MKKTVLIFIIITIVISGVAFYGGMKYTQIYSKSNASQKFMQGNFQDFSNLSPEQRQQRMKQMGTNVTGLRSVRLGDGANSGLISGEIISKDNQSITIKLRDGGSRIIFYSDNTEVSKFTNGTADDLEVGKPATINGTENDDKSITAQSIQLR